MTTAPKDPNWKLIQLHFSAIATAKEDIRRRPPSPPATLPKNISMIKQFKARYPDSITEVFCEKVTPLGIKINKSVRPRVRRYDAYFDTRQDAVKWLIEQHECALEERQRELKWAQETVQETTAHISALRSEII